LRSAICFCVTALVLFGSDASSVWIALFVFLCALDNGQTGTVRPGGGTGSNTIDLSGGTGSIQPRLRKVSDDQVSGAGIFSKGDISIIRYMDRATGHIFESNADTMARNKISNITMPQIHETLWSADGSELIARYLKEDGVTIQSFYGRLPATTTSNSVIEGYFLPSNIKELSLFANKILYLDPTVDGALVTSDIDGAKKSYVTNLYSRDWLLQLASTKSTLIGAKPSGLVGGDLYTLDMTTGIKLKIMKDILGLTGLMSPDGAYVFASASERRGIASAIYTIKDRTFSTLSVSTLSDKCAWSTTEKNILYCAVPTAIPSGVYPDDWYQGIVSFDDRLWRIDASSSETDLILDPSIEVGIDMDMTKLGTDTSGLHLIFVDKKDSSLWVLDLK
jgi:hypothetical protein